ncbi:hypothetical protein GOODEAATRI_001016 [Goodea atripinnis]|uniref:UBA domain-containing protein n=1 Tax=Goodea atripinnis TaxID=208336 RepID=A0ABV0NHK8_9TELE
METEEEQHITTLLCMGFPDPDVIRKALRLAKNDINEAVALLTNESPGLGYGYEPMESGPTTGLGSSGDGENSGRTGTSGFDPPPAYHDVVDGERSNDENGNCSGGSMEFPTTNLYELESRVFTDHWSIPYKREESLGKCLIASSCLARHDLERVRESNFSLPLSGLADADENCKRFMERCMPEAFKKVRGEEMNDCWIDWHSLTESCVSALVQPLGVCAEYLNPSLVQRLVSIPELLSAIKLLCMRFQRELVAMVDDLRLDTLLRMLKTPHFSTKMNSLKEVMSKTVKNAIDTDKLLDWLVENSVLSIALEGNIDQAQYCERIKGIIELLGSKLSLDELTKIWRIQVLEVLWELAHLPTLPTSMVQQALEEHLGILSDAYAVKETVKRSYIIKCIEDIKKDLKKNFEIVKLITGSLVCCHRLAVTASGNNGLSASTLVDGRYTYQEVSTSYIFNRATSFLFLSFISFTGPVGPLVKLLIVFLIKVRSIVFLSICVQYLDSHLRFLAFFLQEASLYLVWNRAKELWECLVSGPDVCELDREMCFEWFTKGQHDLESDVQQQLFKEKILKLEPYEITMNGERLNTDPYSTEADSVSLHKKFIADCYKRLEDMYSFPRTILPHGASFNGHPVTLHITYESTKDTFTLEHVSMTMCVDFLFCICQMTMNRDQKLLSQLGFSDEQSLTVKSSGTGTPSGSSESSASVSSSSSSAIFNSAYALEQVLREYNNAL